MSARERFFEPFRTSLYVAVVLLGFEVDALIGLAIIAILASALTGIAVPAAADPASDLAVRKPSEGKSSSSAGDRGPYNILDHLIYVLPSGGIRSPSLESQKASPRSAPNLK